MGGRASQLDGPIDRRGGLVEIAEKSQRPTEERPGADAEILSVGKHLSGRVLQRMMLGRALEVLTSLRKRALIEAGHPSGKDRRDGPGIGRTMHGSLPSAEPEPDGLRTSLGLSVVVAKHLGRTLSRIGEEPLQRLGSPYVQRPTPIVRQALVGDLLYERMLERVPPRCAGCDLMNELCGLQVVETTRQISLLQPGNRGQHG